MNPQYCCLPLVGMSFNSFRNYKWGNPFVTINITYLHQPQLQVALKPVKVGAESIKYLLPAKYIFYILLNRKHLIFYSVHFVETYFYLIVDRCFYTSIVQNVLFTEKFHDIQLQNHSVFIYYTIFFFNFKIDISLQ